MFFSSIIVFSLFALAAAAPTHYPHSRRAPNRKRGLAKIEAHPEDIKHAANSRISWAYGWKVEAPAVGVPGVEWIPMQWGERDIKQLGQKLKGHKGPKILLGFNEPDFNNQAHLSVPAAVKLWKEHILPLKKQGWKLGAPGVSSAPSGKQWIVDFMNQCKDCGIDFIPLHWYGNGVQYFRQYIEEMHRKFPQKPIWVTEFASDSKDPKAILAFMRDSLKFLDGAAYVEKYSWFSYGRNSNGLASHLLGPDGKLNELGKYYVKG